MADNTLSQQRGLVPFKPGQSGNPLGRPKGSRSKLAEDFLTDVLNEWQSHGAVALSDMREKSPGDFVKMVAGLLPKDINLNLTDNLSELSDDEVLGEIRKLTASLAPFLAIAGAGDEASGIQEQPAQLH